jgi:hypothetical protein
VRTQLADAPPLDLVDEIERLRALALEIEAPLTEAWLVLYKALALGRMGRVELPERAPARSGGVALAWEATARLLGVTDRPIPASDSDHGDLRFLPELAQHLVEGAPLSPRMQLKCTQDPLLRAMVLAWRATRAP